MRSPLRVLLIATITFASACASAAGVAVATGSTATPVPARLAEQPTATELALFRLANEDRARAGLSPLSFDFDALAVARARAAAQPSDGPLTHFDERGNMAFAGLLNALGMEYQLAGENLARIAAPAFAAPDRAQTSLMNSPSHRANILEPSFALLAVGSAVDGQGRVVFAQLFRAL